MFWITLTCCTIASAESSYKKAFKQYNSLANQPLKHIDGNHFKQLQSGEVVVTIDQSPLGWRATGLIVIDKPMIDTWLTSRDQCQKQQKSTHEIILADHGGGSEDWYGLIDLPWPLKDRHWLIRTKANIKLANASRNNIWERYWTLAKNARQKINAAANGGELPSLAKGAIFTPENAGAWFVIELTPNKSILGYQVTTSIGGVVPDKVMMQLVSSTMDEMLGDMKKRTDDIREHYVDPHPVLFGGDKRAIPFFD